MFLLFARAVQDTKKKRDTQGESLELLFFLREREEKDAERWTFSGSKSLVIIVIVSPSSSAF